MSRITVDESLLAEVIWERCTMPYILNNPIQAYRNRTKNSRKFKIQKGILKGKGSENKRNIDLLMKRERKERNELAKQKDRQTINQVGENSGPPLSNWLMKFKTKQIVISKSNMLRKKREI